MDKKTKVTLYVDREVIRESKKLGLNLSVIAENALKEAVRWLKGADCSDPHNFSDGNILNSKGHRIICRRVGGRPSGESLRKLCPSSRFAGPRGLGREARLWYRNETYRLAL